MNRRRAIVAILGGLPALALLAAACGGGAAPTATPTRAAPTATTTSPAPASAQATATPTRAAAATPTTTAPPTPTSVTRRAPQGTVTAVVDVTADQGGSDVRKTGTVTVLGYYMNVYEPLLLGNTDPVTPKLQLASGWSLAPNGLGWIFDIKKGIKFHNGAELTAQDVAATMEADRRLALGYAASLPRILDRVEVNDANRVTFWTKKPTGGFLSLFMGTGTAYFLVHNKAVMEQVGDDGVKLVENTIGTGPFRMTKKKVDELLEFEANTNYWGEVPSYKTLKMPYVLEAATKVAMLKTGEADMIPIGGADYLDIRKDPRYSFVQTTAGGASYIPLRGADKKDSPLSDIRVRKALIQAVDMNSIIKNLFFGLSNPQDSLCVGGAVGYEKVDFSKLYPYDPAKAKQLLAEAGYPDGANLGSILYVKGQEPTFLAVQDFWKKVGVRVDLDPVDQGTWINRMFADKAGGIFQWGTSWRSDCEQLLFWHTHVGYEPTSLPLSSVPRNIYDEFARGRDSVDIKVRQEAFSKVSRYLVEQALFLPGWTSSARYALGPRIAPESWQWAHPQWGNYHSMNTIKLKQGS